METARKTDSADSAIDKDVVYIPVLDEEWKVLRDTQDMAKLEEQAELTSLNRQLANQILLELEESVNLQLQTSKIEAEVSKLNSQLKEAKKALEEQAKKAQQANARSNRELADMKNTLLNAQAEKLQCEQNAKALQEKVEEDLLRHKLELQAAGREKGRIRDELHELQARLQTLQSTKRAASTTEVAIGTTNAEESEFIEIPSVGHSFSVEVVRTSQQTQTEYVPMGHAAKEELLQIDRVLQLEAGLRKQATLENSQLKAKIQSLNRQAASDTSSIAYLQKEFLQRESLLNKATALVNEKEKELSKRVETIGSLEACLREKQALADQAKVEHSKLLVAHEQACRQRNVLRQEQQTYLTESQRARSFKDDVRQLYSHYLHNIQAPSLRQVASAVRQRLLQDIDRIHKQFVRN